MSLRIPDQKPRWLALSPRNLAPLRLEPHQRLRRLLCAFLRERPPLSALYEPLVQHHCPHPASAVLAVLCRPLHVRPVAAMIGAVTMMVRRRFACGDMGGAAIVSGSCRRSRAVRAGFLQSKGEGAGVVTCGRAEGRCAPGKAGAGPDLGARGGVTPSRVDSCGTSRPHVSRTGPPLAPPTSASRLESTDRPAGRDPLRACVRTSAPAFPPSSGLSLQSSHGRFHELCPFCRLKPRPCATCPCGNHCTSRILWELARSTPSTGRSRSIRQHHRDPSRVSGEPVRPDIRDVTYVPP
jgi:hypothetical protein